MSKERVRANVSRFACVFRDLTISPHRLPLLLLSLSCPSPFLSLSPFIFPPSFARSAFLSSPAGVSLGVSFLCNFLFINIWFPPNDLSSAHEATGEELQRVSIHTLPCPVGCSLSPSNSDRMLKVLQFLKSSVYAQEWGTMERSAARGKASICCWEEKGRRRAKTGRKEKCACGSHAHGPEATPTPTDQESLKCYVDDVCWCDPCS